MLINLEFNNDKYMFHFGGIHSIKVISLINFFCNFLEV